MKNITPIIKKQLDIADWVDRAVINEVNNTIYIPKSDNIVIEKNKSYLIELNDSLLVNNGDTLLQYNWNKGKIPTHKYYKIDVINILGKMVDCVGIAYDPNTNIDLMDYWQGYFPISKIKILELLP